MRSIWLRFLIGILAPLLGVTFVSHVAAAPAARDYTIAPPPSWVAAPSGAPTTLHVPDEEDGGVVDVMIDDQLRLDRGLEHYMHRVQKVTSHAGIERAGEVEILLDPTYERFVLHGLHVVRGEQRIDAQRSATVRAFDSEDSREQRIYDGSRRVLFLLSDLRVGDVVDFEGSVIGHNPVFGGRVARWMALASSRPTVDRRVRVLASASRPLAFRLHNTTIPLTTRTLGGDTEVTWAQHDGSPVLRDGNEPSWYEARPALVLSEFGSWADVAQWGAKMFEPTTPPSRALAEKIRELRDAQPTPEARALAALRFVQDDVRYLGIELGEHSHRPHAASAVFEQRFGDCKDKVNLLVTMLHGLGIDAEPALVATGLEGHVVDELPRPQAFDHVIARIRIEGRDVWVDPTRTWERGALGQTPIEYGRALVAARDTKDLASLAPVTLAEPRATVKEVFHLKGDTAGLEVTSTFRGRSAHAMRAELATNSRSSLKASYLEYYLKRFPHARATSDVTFEDDETNDVIVVHEAYELPNAVERGRLALYAHSLSRMVTTPKVTQRTSPLSVAYPRFIRHELEVEATGDDVEVSLPEHSVASDGAVAFTMHAERRGRGVRVVYDLQSRADSVAVADLPRHLEVLATIRRAIDQDVQLSDAPRPAKNRSGAGSEKVALILSAVFGLMVAFVATAVFGRRVLVGARRLRWLRKARPDAGQIPANAIRIASRSDALRQLLDGKWPCGHANDATSDVVWSTMTFNGRSVSAARAACRSCGEDRVRYFDLADAATGPSGADA